MAKKIKKIKKRGKKVEISRRLKKVKVLRPKTKKKARNGRSVAVKGSRAELQVRDILQPWWRQAEPGAAFDRTPGSGSWGKHREHDAKGDLVTTLPKGGKSKFPFCIEVKWRKTWFPLRFCTGLATTAWVWWKQCYEDAEAAGKRPMMFVRRDKGNWYVVLDAAHVAELKLPTPNAAVARRTLDSNGLDHVRYLPAVYEISRFLEIDPKVFLPDESADVFSYEFVPRDGDPPPKTVTVRHDDR